MNSQNNREICDYLIKEFGLKDINELNNFARKSLNKKNVYHRKSERIDSKNRRNNI